MLHVAHFVITCDSMKNCDDKCADPAMKVKEVCLKCTTFNPDARGSYKCALKRSCPGINWTATAKKTYLANVARVRG